MENTNPHQEETARLLERTFDVEIKAFAKEQTDQGALARALLRLRKCGAPFDEFEVVSRPFWNAIASAVEKGEREAPVRIPKMHKMFAKPSRRK